MSSPRTDAIELSGFSSPPLTTVRQDFDQVGVELVRLVLGQVRHGADAVHDRVLVPTDMIVQSSTAPPPV